MCQKQGFETFVVPIVGGGLIEEVEPRGGGTPRRWNPEEVEPPDPF